MVSVTPSTASDSLGLVASKQIGRFAFLESCIASVASCSLEFITLHKIHPNSAVINIFIESEHDEIFYAKYKPVVSMIYIRALSFSLYRSNFGQRHSFAILHTHAVVRIVVPNFL